MKNIFALLGTAALLTLSAAAFADSSPATQSVGFEVTAIDQISVSASPGALNITTSVAGQAPTQVTDGATTYSITTNETGKKITATLDTNMPAGVTLTLTAAAPAGATSAGALALSTTGADVVTGITTLTATGLGLTYNLSAVPTAGVVASTTRTVTLTIL